MTLDHPTREHEDARPTHHPHHLGSNATSIARSGRHILHISLAHFRSVVFHLTLPAQQSKSLRHQDEHPSLTNQMQDAL
ncbi:hypothetical protein VTI74DRAFT_3259 [Chaetomium olivicolor]